MAKPDDIPESVWEEAREAIRSGLRDDRCNITVRFRMADETAEGFREAIARALLAAEKRGEERERERCALIAEDHIGSAQRSSEEVSSDIAKATYAGRVWEAGALAAEIRRG